MKMLAVLYVVLFCPVLTLGQLSNDPKALLNWCLDSKYHKSVPGPEDALHEQCEPWKNRACCKSNTTLQLHYGSLYKFNFNHCGHIKNMSIECRKKFLQDECFFECSPNIGPWVVKVPMKTRNERFFEVPLCASDCDAWFEACKDDFTCSENWMHNSNKGGSLTPCTSDTHCRTFADVFKTSQMFCEKVWDHSWKYTEDSQACMRIWFNSSNGNPNDDVAKHYVKKLLGTSGHTCLKHDILLLALATLYLHV